MRTTPINDLILALENIKLGTLREAFEGEEADLVQERNKECTGITLCKNGRGFSVDFNPPLFLVAGVRYVFEEK